MRRTASWGSRDAFTDGHLSTHADAPVVPPGRRTLAATSKAHRQKRHSYARSFGSQAAQQSQDQRRLQSMDRPTLSAVGQERGWGMLRPFVSAEAARRMSAPEAPAGDSLRLSPVHQVAAVPLCWAKMALFGSKVYYHQGHQICQ